MIKNPLTTPETNALYSCCVEIPDGKTYEQILCLIRREKWSDTLQLDSEYDDYPIKNVINIIENRKMEIEKWQKQV